MTSASTLTITDREYGNIRPPTYFEDSENPRRLTSFEQDGLTLHAKKGVTYTINTAGAFGLVFNVQGPGISQQAPQNIGASWSFTATADATYSISVASAQGLMLPGGGYDMPNYGRYTVDVYANVGDDVGLTLPASDIIPIGLPLKARLGTASDSDQAFFSAWRGNAGFFAAYSTQVKDITVEVQSGDGSVIGSSTAGSNGMAVLSVTAPADGMYKALIRSGSYRQEGEFEAFSGQRMDPSATLTVGRPTGDNIAFSDGRNREVWAWGGETQIQTGSGHDTIVGSRESNDVISSGAGDDNIIGFGGLNIVDGGPGRDTYVMTGGHEDFQILKTGDGLQVVGTSVYEVADANGDIIATYAYSSINLLQGIEYVKFMDQTLDVRNARWLRDWITLDRQGSDTFMGFEVLDEARLYEGKRADFTLSIQATPRSNPPAERDPYELKVTVSGAGFSDTLYSVERVMFDDGGVAVDMYPGGLAHSSVVAMLFTWGAGSLTDRVLAGKVLEFFRLSDSMQAAAAELVMHQMIPGARGSNEVLVDYVIQKVAGNSGRWVDARGALTPIAEWRESTLQKLRAETLTQVELVEQALLSPDMNHQVELTGLATTGLLYQDEPIPWGGG